MSIAGYVSRAMVTHARFTVANRFCGSYENELPPISPAKRARRPFGAGGAHVALTPPAWEVADQCQCRFAPGLAVSAPP